MDSQVRCGDSRGRRLRRKMQTMTKRFESQEKRARSQPTSGTCPAREGVACRPAKVYPVVGFMLLTGNIIYGAQTSERVQNGKFHICCMGGKIVLPPIPQRDEIQEMLMNQNHFYYEHLKTHIRHYNTSFSFASFMHSQGRIDPRAPPNRGIYIFFLHGVAYHGISHSQPHPDKETAFGQIYFLDPQEAQNVRVRNANQHLHFELDETLTQIFESLMREHNVFAEVYQKFRDHVRDLTPEQNRRASLLFYDRPNQHRCRWHSSHPFASSICRCTVLSPNISIWTWGYNIDLISANSATRKVQLSEYARNHLADRDGQGVGNPLLNYGSLLQQLICDWAHRREQLKLHFIQRMQLRGVSFQEYHNLRHQIFERNEAPRVADLPVEEQNDDIPVLQYANNYIPPLAAAQGVAANQVPPAQGDNQVPPPPPPGQGDNQVPPPGQNPPGVAVLLPSSFPGSPRNMVQRYSDVMSMMAALGKPDLFITFSCNPTWPEIVDNLKPYWSREDQVTLQCRVFHIKLKDFVKQLVDDMIFGRVKYCTYSIEFQKRGLPHAHFLIGLHSHDKLYTPEQVDFCISAEIPRNSMEVVVQQPEQLPHMIHGPCGAANPDAPCMLNGQCTKKYPKNFQNTTTFRSNGYPIYKRPDNGETVTKGDVVLDNRWVVPHNRYLLLRYNCHINVEYCTMVTVAKYLFKYIFKSVCQANVQLTVGDEIQNYEACRFLTSPEAAWQLLCNETYQHSHSILRLSVHLPNEQRVYQRTGRGGELLISNDAGKTTLTEWFASNHAQKLLAEEELIGKPAKDGNAAIQSPTRDATGTKTRNPRIFVEKTGVVYDVPVYIAIEKLLNTIYTKAKEPVPGPSRAIMYQHISQSHSINLRSSRDVHVLLNRTILEESESIDDFVNNDPIIRYDLIPDRELFLSSLQSSSDDNNPRPDTPPFNVQNDGAHDSPSASQDSQESNYTDHEPILCPSRFDFERLPTLAREGVAGRSTKVYPVIGFMLLTGNIIYGAQTR
ncbi:uncharacterized protein DMENIID0001_005670 [Sergentomyia squamirostris]